MHLLPLAEHWDPGPWFLVFPLFWLTVFALFWVLLARRFGGRRGRGGAREIPAERFARGELLQAVIAFDGRLRSGLSDDAVAQLRTQLGRLAQNVCAD